MAISALSQDGHESRSECLFIPVWRPIHDPRVKSHDFQCPLNNRSRSAEHQVPASVRLDVILGPHQSTDAAGIYEREVRQIDNERRAGDAYESVSQAIRCSDIQLSMQRHKVEVGKQITGRQAEHGQHGELLFRRGLQVARRQEVDQLLPCYSS